MELATEDLPPYRRLRGQPKALHSCYGWQPIHFESPAHARFYSQAPIGQSLGAIEQSLTDDKRDGVHAFPYPPEIKAKLMKQVGFPFVDVCAHLEYGVVWNIIDQVRNLVLNWSLELEKVGAVGRDMIFTAE
jgi:hypothetical protein